MNTHSNSPLHCTFASLVALVAGLILGFTGTARSAEPDIAPGSPLIGVNLLDIAPGAGGQPVSRNTTVRLRGFGVFSSGSGSLNYGDDFPGVRNTLDLESTLGMDLDKFTGGVLLGFNLGDEKRLHIDLSYDGYYDYNGSRDVGSISFDGQIFTADVSSSLRVHEGAVTLGYDLFRSDGPGLTFTPTLGVRMFFIDATLGEDASPLSRSAELWAPVPELGAALRWDLTENIYVRGSAAGIYLGELASYANLTAEAGFDFNANVGVFIGYRYWLVRIDYSDDEFRFDNNAIYTGIELRM
jgi:hypothetical protein